MNARTLRRWALVGLYCALLLVWMRGVDAYRQCAQPVFARSFQCFTHDFVTGEDLP